MGWTRLPQRRRHRAEGTPTGVGGTLPGCALIVALGILSAMPAEATRPNVLFISIDDLNEWVEPFNDPARGKPKIETPNLRKLASRGVAFTNAHTPVPVCRPTRASIMAGVYPRNNRTTIENYSNRTLEFTGVTTLTQHFRRHGYLALGGGKIFPALSKPERHWDVFELFARPPDQKRNPSVLLNGLTDMHPKDPFDWGAVEYEVLEMSDVQIAEWAIEALGKDYDRPFFLGVGFHFPHLPWYLPRVHLDRYPTESVALPVVREDDLDDVPPEGRKIAWWSPRTKTTDYEGSDHRKVLDAGVWKSAVRAYSAASTFVDDQIGRVLEALDNSAHADNTIVVAFADNGWHLGEKQRWRKMALWEESTRIPLVISYPKMLPRGREVGFAVSLVDLYPTLLEMAGLPAPDHELDGESLIRTLDGGNAAGERFALSVWGRGNVAIRDDRWRYIRYARSGEELYDHAGDRMEHVNLLALPDAERHAERVAEFNRIIDRYHPREAAGKE